MLSLGTVLIICLVIMAVGSHPRWQHARNWGYVPSSGLTVVAVVVLVLLLTHRI